MGFKYALKICFIKICGVKLVLILVRENRMKLSMRNRERNPEKRNIERSRGAKGQRNQPPGVT
jgi:hypothetical protein